MPSPTPTRSSVPPPLPPTPLPPELGAAIAAGSIRTIVLSGGTFDPPHAAHLAMALLARDRIEQQERGGRGVEPGSAWLLLVPAARSPFKATGPVASDADRTAMLLLAAAHVERTSVWTDEIDRAAAAPQAPSYTIDTVARLRAAVDSAGGRDVAIRLLIGADQAVQFHKWRDYPGLLAMVEPVVLPRGGIADGAALQREMDRTGAWTDEQLDAWRSRMLPLALLPTSATQIRAGLAASATSESREAAQRSLLPAVWDYIRQHGLYR